MSAAATPLLLVREMFDPDDPMRVIAGSELDELQRWLQHAASDPHLGERYMQLALALQQLRRFNAQLRKDNGRLRERIRLHASRRDDPIVVCRRVSMAGQD